MLTTWPRVPKSGMFNRFHKRLCGLFRKIDSVLLVILVGIGGLVAFNGCAPSPQPPRQDSTGTASQATKPAVPPTHVSSVLASVESRSAREPKPETSLSTAKTTVEKEPSHEEQPDNIDNGKVDLIMRGDHISVVDRNGKSAFVRFRGIDAPDSGQKLSNESKAALSKLIAKQDVEVHWLERDRTTAKIADVYLGDEWINLQMIRDGWAWYDEIHVDSDELREAQEEARKAKRGIWAMQNPVPPWEYRAAQRAKDEANSVRVAQQKEAKKQADAEKREIALAADYDYVPSLGTTRTSGGPVNVRGHTRTSKSGKTYYVHSYTRSK